MMPSAICMAKAGAGARAKRAHADQNNTQRRHRPTVVLSIVHAFFRYLFRCLADGTDAACRKSLPSGGALESVINKLCAKGSCRIDEGQYSSLRVSSQSLDSHLDVSRSAVIAWFVRNRSLDIENLERIECQAAVMPLGDLSGRRLH